VEKVALNFGRPDEKPLDRMTLQEAKKYDRMGHFAPGSMRPKIRAIINYLEHGGKRAIVTNPENLENALLRKTGTHIVM
jgi:carbamate kinase